jgi:hypothetical protein
VQVSHTFTPGSAVFDEDNLVSCAGLVPVMALAEQAGLTRLLNNKIRIESTRVKSGAANPAPKLATLIAGMCAGADYIDDVDLVRAGGMKTLFERVYAPSTVGTLLREFTFGHARQLDSVLSEHLAGLCQQVNLLPGSDARAFLDIDSLLRPVHGHRKQGASYGHTKIAGKQVLRKGLSPLVTTLSTDTAAPVLTGIRLRAGKANSGKGAARMVAQALSTARAAGVTGQIIVRGDSAYGSRAVIRVCRRNGAVFSLVLTRNAAVQRAIDTIAEDAWTPVRYPGAVRDCGTGAWISDAEIADTMAGSGPYPAVTARLIGPELVSKRCNGSARTRWDCVLHSAWHSLLTSTRRRRGPGSRGGHPGTAGFDARYRRELLPPRHDRRPGPRRDPHHRRAERNACAHQGIPISSSRPRRVDDVRSAEAKIGELATGASLLVNNAGDGGRSGICSRQVDKHRRPARRLPAFVSHVLASKEAACPLRRRPQLLDALLGSRCARSTMCR